MSNKPEQEPLRSHRICESPDSMIRGNVCNLKPKKVLLEEPVSFQGIRTRYNLVCPLNEKPCKFSTVSDPGYCIPWCDQCGGTGRIMHQVGIDDPNYGKSYQCPNKINGWSYSETGIPVVDYKKITGMKIINTKPMAQMVTALKPVMARGWGFLYIHGPAGLGKTMMDMMVVIRSVQQKHTAMYWRHNKLIDWLREAYDMEHSQMEYRNRLAKLAELDCLAIDEYGRDRETDFGIQSISSVLNDRYEKAMNHGGICIVSSNNSPKETLDDYLVDRFSDQQAGIVALSGSSLRAASQDLQEVENTQLYWWQE